MNKFTWIIDRASLNDGRVLDLLANYRKRDGSYEVNENIYKAMRTLIQDALKDNEFSYLLGEEQNIVLYHKKHFRINHGDVGVLEIALGYAELQGIDRKCVEKALGENR